MGRVEVFTQPVSHILEFLSTAGDEGQVTLPFSESTWAKTSAQKVSDL